MQGPHPPGLFQCGRKEVAGLFTATPRSETPAGNLTNLRLQPVTPACCRSRYCSGHSGLLLSPSISHCSRPTSGTPVLSTGPVYGWGMQGSPPPPPVHAAEHAGPRQTPPAARSWAGPRKPPRGCPCLQSLCRVWGQKTFANRLDRARNPGE